MSHIAAKDAMSNSLGAQTLGLGGTAVVEIGRRIRTPLGGTAEVKTDDKYGELLAAGIACEN